MLIMTSIIRVGQSQFVTSPMDEDSYDRIMQDLHVVENIPNDRLMEKVYLKDTKAAFAKQVQAEDKRLADKKSKEDTSVTVQADDAIMFRQFTKKNGADSGDEVSIS
jgi:coatomer subunit beta